MLRVPPSKNLALQLSALTFLLLFLPIEHRPWALSSEGSTLGRFTYHFFHVSILHWLLNAWALLSLAFYYKVDRLELLLGYLVASSVPATSLYTLTGASILVMPTVGLSGLAYALMGLILPRIVDKKRYLGWSALSLALGFLLPHVNAYVHLWAFASALPVGFILHGLCKQK